jgi:hypothetical protein
VSSTVDAALERFRARFDHPPIDPRDVEERIAARFGLAAPATILVVAIEHPPACRIFVFHGRIPQPWSWRSAYVHAIADVDAILDRLLAREDEERGADAQEEAA